MLCFMLLKYISRLQNVYPISSVFWLCICPFVSLVILFPPLVPITLVTCYWLSNVLTQLSLSGSLPWTFPLLCLSPLNVLTLIGLIRLKYHLCVYSQNCSWVLISTYFWLFVSLPSSSSFCIHHIIITIIIIVFNILLFARHCD